MKIRELQVYKKRITREKACAYSVADRFCGDMVEKSARHIAYEDGYMKHSLMGNPEYGWHARFKTVVEREMTPAEEIAWHITEAKRICNNSKRCVADCPFSDGSACWLGNQSMINCNKFMKGKEVIE